jgi:hypothetical protein
VGSTSFPQLPIDSLLELLDLRITCGGVLGLVRVVLAILTSLSPLLAPSLFLFGFALVLQSAQSLTNRCGFDASLLFRCIIEIRGRVFSNGTLVLYYIRVCQV